MLALQGQLWKMLILSRGKGNPKLCGFIFKSLLLVLIELFALVWVELCNSQTEISEGESLLWWLEKNRPRSHCSSVSILTFPLG